MRQGDLTGSLYLIGSRNTTLTPGGQDWLGLYLFDETALGNSNACLLGLRGVAQNWSADGSDPGSDDLQFSWAVIDTYFGGR